MARPTRKKKEKKNIADGIAFISSSFNNIKVCITDKAGNVLAWSTSGHMGFKGSRKSTPYAAQMTAEDCGRKAQEHGIKNLEIRIKGPGSGREAAMRALNTIGINVSYIRDITPFPHNGCRPPKKRRV